MSQQPCLPVPRRRKRVSSQDGGEADNSSSTMVFQNVESMDANEYLAAVVQQASQMPNVFVATSASPNKTSSEFTKNSRPNEEKDEEQVHLMEDETQPNRSQQQQQQQQQQHTPKGHVPIDGSAASLSYLVSRRTALFEPPTAQHLPFNTTSWVETTLANFSELRDYLDSCRRNGVGGKETNRTPVPRLKDRPGWHVFCVGRDEAYGNVGSYFDDDDDDDDHNNMNAGDGHDDDDDKKFPLWKQKLPESGNEPSVQLVLQMDQVMIRRVLSHLSYYVEDGWSPCTPRRSAWLYTLLARLERPLHRDDAAVLYGLLKELTNIRANKLNVRTEREELARLNMLIAIIGVYFEQGGGYDGVMTLSASCLTSIATT